MLRLAFALVVTSLVSTPAMAAPCRDTKGKFIKCPTKTIATTVKKRCRDAKGHFKKC